MVTPQGHVANVFIKILSWALNGVMIYLLWGWFMVPAFGFAKLDLLLATGLGMAFRSFISQYIPREDKHIKYLLIYTIYSPLLAIGCGYALHLARVRGILIHLPF